MDAVFRICGVALMGLCALLVLGEKQRSIARIAAVFAVVVIFAFCIGSPLGTLLGQAEEIYKSTAFSQYALILLKAMGISFVAGITMKICESCGEGGLSYAVGVFSACEILVLSLPLVNSLLDIAGEVLGK